MSFGSLGTLNRLGDLGGLLKESGPAVATPSITAPADAATDIGETPTITTSAFAVTGDTDTHASTDWQIASDAAFTTIVVQSIDDTSNKVSWAVPAGNLSTSTTYYIRARHTGTTYGDSAYSATVSFTTAAAFAYSWTNTEGSAFEAQADTTGWDDTLRGHIDQLISDLKSGQVNATNTYSGFDRILLMDLPNSADSLRYLNAPTLTATNVSATAHAANEGFTGDGSADYIDTGYNPVDDGTNFTQNSASFGVFVRTAATTGAPAFTGSRGSNAGNCQWVGGRGYSGRGPCAGSFFLDDTSYTLAATVGLLVKNRSNAGAVQSYVDGVANKTATSAASSALSSGDHFYILADNNGGATAYADAQASLWFAGRSFTANEQADIYDAFNRYRAAREAEAIIAAMSPTPDATRQTLIHGLVYGLHVDGLWDKLDRLWIMAAHSSQPARLDWKAPATAARMLTPVSAPTFTADQGYTGDGSTSYLNTNFTPSTDGVQYTQNSACAGVWVRAVGASGTKAYFGVNESFTQQVLIDRRADGSSWQSFGPNDNTALNSTTLSESATGLLVANRSGASARENYRNGSSEATNTQASVGLPAFSIFLLARNSGGTANLHSDGQISAAFVAGSLDATEQSNLYSRLNTYMTGL